MVIRFLKLHLTAKSAPVYRNIDRIWKNADWMFCHRRFQVTSMRHTLLAGSGITLDWFMNTFVKHEGITSKEMFAQMEEEIEKHPAWM